MPAAYPVPDSTNHAVAWDTESFDTDGIWDVSPNPSRLTIPANMGGRWIVNAYVQWASNSTGIRAVWILKNATTLVALSEIAVSASIPLGRLCVVDMLQMIATDYLELYVFQNSGGSLNIADAHFGASWQGPSS